MPCEPLRADAPKREQVHFLRYYGSVQGTLPTNPLGSTKKISYILYDIFLCKDKGFSVIYHGVALQHEPLQADNKRRETQARSICGHRVQFHSQQIRHEVSAKGAVQCTIC